MMDGIMGGVMGLMMLLFMLIVAGAVIVGAFGGGRVLKGLKGRAAQPSSLTGRPGVETPAGQPSALEQAKERFARGEIDHAELDRLLDDLIKNDYRAGGNR